MTLVQLKLAATGTNSARFSASGQLLLATGVAARPLQALPVQPTTMAAVPSAMVAVWRPSAASVMVQLSKLLETPYAVPLAKPLGLASGALGGLVEAKTEMPGA